ncbi:hypothetical protein Ac2012v2_007154 [Leucoagaricus gongylophorus]
MHQGSSSSVRKGKDKHTANRRRRQSPPPCSLPSEGKAVVEGSAVLVLVLEDEEETARRAAPVLGEAKSFSHPSAESDDLHTILRSCAKLCGSHDTISHPLAGVMSAMACSAPHLK